MVKLLSLFDLCYNCGGETLKLTHYREEKEHCSQAFSAHSMHPASNQASSFDCLLHAYLYRIVQVGRDVIAETLV